MSRRFGAALILLCLTPSLALADAVSPILNFFHKDTWLPATIVTLAIILVESALLRRQIQQVRYLGALWRSAVLNLSSSLSGTVLLLVLARDSYFLWNTMSLVLPLFIITLLTEIPLLHLLFRQLPLTWDRACRLGFRINLISYAVVFVIEIGLLVGWVSYAGHLDQKDLATWKRPELLGRASGLIYATETMGGSHGLRVFDPLQDRWNSLTNCPSLDPNKWDVEGRVCAFVRWAVADWKNRNLVIVSLPEFAILHELSPASFSDDQFDNWQGVTDVSISPDQGKLALLFRVTDAVAYRDRSGYYDLGSKCRLIVIDLQSGKEITRGSRWASDHGLCWLPDSSAVLFPSFRDEGLYKTTKAEVRGDTSYGIGYGRSDQFSRSLYSFHIKTKRITHFSDGYAPSLSGGNQLVLVQDGEVVRILDPKGREHQQFHVARLGYSKAVMSPSGDLLIAQIRQRVPFRGGGRLAIIDLNNPELRHIIDDSLVYRYEWLGGGK